MCVDARYLIQYIHFSFHRFCDDESSRGFATVFKGELHPRYNLGLNERPYHQ